MQEVLLTLKRIAGKALALVGLVAFSGGGTMTYLHFFSESARAQGKSDVSSQLNTVLPLAGGLGLPAWAFPVLGVAGLFFVVVGVKWMRAGGKRG
jgi:hypothetical protein